VPRSRPGVVSRRHALALLGSTATAGCLFGGAGTGDADIGERLWERPVDNRTTAAPTVAGDAVLVADAAGRIRALDAATGEVAWETTVDGTVRHSVAVADDSVVVAHDGGVTALTRDGGDDRWSTGIGREPTAPLLTADAVLVETGRDVVSLAHADGTERWRIETRERNYTDVVLSGVTGTPVAVDGAVLVATQAGDVYALDDG